MLYANDKNNQKIKPIETEYNGYRFRSRLEARWAVFFDTMGINYEYENEGYDLKGNIGYYLPDFWLPQFKSHVEIKPDFLDAHCKLCNLFRERISPIILISGTPWEYSGVWFGWDLTDSGGGSGDFDAAFFGGPVLVLDNLYRDRTYHITDIFEPAPDTIIDTFSLKGVKSWSLFKDTAYQSCFEAIGKSKRARFEHGEKP